MSQDADIPATWGILRTSLEVLGGIVRASPLGRWHSVCSSIGMTRFLTRFVGVLVLDPAAFEEIEANRHVTMQSVIVVLMVCLAGGFAAKGLGLVGLSGFVTGTIVSLGAFLVWAATVTTLGTITLPERQTRSDLPELLRVLGFATAPGVFVAFAAMASVTPLVMAIVMAWMIATAVMGVRQALDYRSLPRAIAVCLVGWVLSAGAVFAALMMFSTSVS